MIVFKGRGEVNIPDELIIRKTEVEDPKNGEPYSVTLAKVGDTYIVIYQHFCSSPVVFDHFVDIVVTSNKENFNPLLGTSLWFQEYIDRLRSGEEISISTPSWGLLYGSS